MAEGKGMCMASRFKCDDSHGQGLSLTEGRLAGTGFGGKGCDTFTASSQSTMTILPEHFSGEIAIMRFQLDQAVREHRIREDRLIAHLLEQASINSGPRDGEMALPQVRFDHHRLSPATKGIVAGLNEGDSQRDQPGGRKGHPGKTMRSGSSFLAGGPQSIFQHSMSLEVVDMMDDMMARRQLRTDARLSGDKMSFNESFESFMESSLLKLLYLINKCLHLQEPARSGILASTLRSRYWDVLICFAIALNAIYMIFQVDWQFDNYKSELELPLAMQCIEIGLIIFFLLELLMKICVHRLYYFLNDDMRWNIFDFFLVMLSLYDLIIEHLGKAAGGNLTFFRSLRILKLTRVLRVVRLLKVAGQLRRMMLSILGSMTSLFWAFAVLFFVFYMFGILAVQSLSAKLKDVSSWMPPDEFETIEGQITMYFGSVSSAMLTYFMATTGGNDWSVFYSVLSQVSEFDAAVLIFVVGFTQIALFNVLTGIFVENAMKVGKPDRDSLALERRREELKEAKAFRSFLQQKIGRDCSSTITFEEFESLSQNTRVNAVFHSMGLDVKDAKLFFDMIDQKEEAVELDIDFVVEACMKMKGPATSLDVQSLLFKVDQLAGRLDRLSIGALSISPKETRDAAGHLPPDPLAVRM